MDERAQELEQGAAGSRTNDYVIWIFDVDDIQRLQFRELYGHCEYQVSGR